MTRDLRRYSRQTNVRLVAGFLLLAFVVGGGLIYIFWGRNAALMGLVCMGLALVPAALVWLALAVIEWAARKAQE